MRPEIPLSSDSRLRAVSNPDRGGANDCSGLAPTDPGNEQMQRRSIGRRRPVPVAIIHRSALFRAGLRHVLARNRFRIVVECCTPGELPDDAFAGEEMLALIDIADSDADAVLAQLRSLHERSTGIRIVLLSKERRPDELLSFIAAGASGYLSSNEISSDALLQSLELVLLGCVVIPRGLNGSLRRGLLRLGDPSASDEIAPPACRPGGPEDQPTRSEMAAGLSNREKTVLRELMRGASNKHIARAINIAEATVKVHVKSLLRKIGVTNRTQAAMWAMDHCPKISMVAGLLSAMA